MKILFLCTANKNRSKTAEDYFSAQNDGNEYRSAGLSYKWCERYGTTICTEDLLAWANKIYVFEDLHIERIKEYAGTAYLGKITNLNIPDHFKYMDGHLIKLIKSSLS
ncbi:MAG: putative protein tyrosine phosphatase [Oleiphilaceae bacterium]|jgi:predicted protein tyrosine phosphatase